MTMIPHDAIDALRAKPPTRRQWREAAMHLPVLIAERDAAEAEIVRLSRLLNRWDAEMERTPLGTRERDAQDTWWIRHLDDLVAASDARAAATEALATLAETIPSIPAATAPYWEWSR